MKIVFSFFTVALMLCSCHSNSQQNNTKQETVNDRLTNMNRIMVANESKAIDSFIVRHNFKTQMTGTGLRYEIYSHGAGEKPQAHDEVEIKYKVYLLNGTLCYSSDSTGNVKFKLGEGEQVRGLDEGVALMIKGDKAHFVLPAHLAYGLSGDQNKILPAKSLYYEVELVNVVKK